MTIAHVHCDACGQAHTPFEFGPMLHDHIWQQITEPGERTLCAKYMDQRTIKRLGRSTTIVLLLLLVAPASAQDASLFSRGQVFHDAAGRVTGSARTDANGVTHSTTAQAASPARRAPIATA